jgi:3-hydroxyisobutyrate dehydrogenase-like beta-hydroxyacid dehydrogenase
VSRSIGFIGLGHMGLPMCGRLLEAGHALTVFNRSPEKASELVGRGARLAGSPAEVARQVDLVISMLADGPALLDVALGEQGVLAGARPELLFADMSTVSPSESERLATALGQADVGYLRAPVSGSTTLAATGKLTILVSGPQASYEQALEIFNVLGQQSFYLGSGEEARVLKLALNMMVGTTMAALAESLTLGQKAGLDWRQMLEIFCHSAVGSPLVNYKAAQLEQRDFAAAFSARLMHKDFDLALEAARQLEVATPVTALVREMWQATIGSGWGERDFSAVLLLVERASGMETVPRP